MSYVVSGSLTGTLPAGLCLLPAGGVPRGRGCRCRVRWDVRPWIADEAVPVRHLHSRERRLIQHVMLADDAVQKQEIGRRLVDLIRCQRAGMIEWHRAADVVPDGGRVRPVA